MVHSTTIFPGRECTMLRLLKAFTLVFSLAVFLVGAAHAQLGKDDQKCINEINARD